MTSRSGTQRVGVVQVAPVDQKLSNLSKRKPRPTESESEIYKKKKPYCQCRSKLDWGKVSS